MLRAVHLLWILLLLAGAWSGVPAYAAQPGAGPCWGAATLAGRVADAPAKVAAWHCRPNNEVFSAERVVVRLPARAADGEPARLLRAGIGQFEQLVLIAQGSDGSRTVASFRAGEVTPVIGHPLFTVPLPRVAEPAVFYAVFDRPGSRSTLRKVAAVAGTAGQADADRSVALLLAVLTGMLLIPALLDLGFFVALRERFFVWHAVLTLNFALLLSCWSGVIAGLLPISMPVWQQLLMLSLGVNGVVASLFSRSYALSSRGGGIMGRLLLGGAVFSLLLIGLHLAGVFGGSAFRGSLYVMGLVPVLALLCMNLFFVVRHGSRLVRLQVLGWAPLLLFFVAQFVGDSLAVNLPNDALPLLYIGVLVISVLTACGVTLRFLEVSRERDAAQARANVMGNLAERDHLTGLLNRRAVDTRFKDLRAQGYDTMALIDLDHFKAINDVSGHAVGDHVLEITARVLASDPDNIAVRLGGEEFMLLLRGTGSSGRAEKLRRMVSVRVAREVDGLEQIVTASMGLLSLPAGSFATPIFSSAYSRADLLLYEAKREGRNRTKAAQWSFHDQAAADDAHGGEGDIRDRPAAVA